MARRRVGPYKVGEIPPPLTHTFKEKDGTRIDLTGCTAVAVVRLAGVEVELPVTVAVDQSEGGGTRGDVTLTWSDGDIHSRGSGEIEFWTGDGTGDFRPASDTFTFRVNRAVATTTPSL